jgi:hypothetical protein
MYDRNTQDSITFRVMKEFPHCHTLLRGIHPTLFPDIVHHLKMNLIYRGEGEWPTCELVKSEDGYYLYKRKDANIQ